MSALFIVNRQSQRVAAKGSRLAQLASLYAQDFPIELYDIGDFQFLPEKVRQSAQAGHKQVYIEGGDGTVQGVLSEFLRQAEAFPNGLPDFAIIAGGMTNQVAKNIGLKPPMMKAALGGNLSTNSTALLQVETSDSRVHYGFIFSTGAVPMVTEYTKNTLHKNGIGGSMAVAGGILKGISGSNQDVLQPTPIKLHCLSADVTIEKNHIGTVLTTLPSLIMGFDPFWGKGNGPLRLTYVDEAYRGLYRNVAGLWLGGKNKDRSRDGLQSWNVSEAQYDYDGPCVLDGEPIISANGAYLVTASPALNFIQPR